MVNGDHCMIMVSLKSVKLSMPSFQPRKFCGKGSNLQMLPGLSGLSII